MSLQRSYISCLMAAITAEFQKLKGSAIWLGVISIPVIGVFLGSGSYYLNQALLHGNTWASLWTQVALFYGYFFYPLIISVIAAYLFRLEHFDHNWNAVMTFPVPVSVIWFSKLFVLFVFAFILEAIEMGLFLLSGFFVFHFTDALPPDFYWSLIGGPFCVMASGSLQLYLAMRIKSFAIPPAICFVFCVAGLYCYSKGYWLFPNTLAIIGINAQHLGAVSFPDLVKCLGGTVFWVVLFSFLAVCYLKKHDVET